jgi:hypothetical protein
MTGELRPKVNAGDLQAREITRNHSDSSFLPHSLTIHSLPLLRQASDDKRERDVGGNVSPV